MLLPVLLTVYAASGWETEDRHYTGVHWQAADLKHMALSTTVYGC